MGKNIFYLADIDVPSYRRPRAQPASPVAQGSWVVMARRRAVAPAQPAAHACNDGPTPSRPALTRPAESGAILAHAPAVRVTRAASTAVSNGATGRLRISGRLIDVCAELERLAAAEAALSEAQPRCA